MLIKLTPEQVERYWDDIRVGIKEAIYTQELPDNRTMTNILKGIMLDKMQVFAVVENEELYGIVLTAINTDGYTGVKTCVIYALYLHKPLSIEKLSNNFKLLKKFAESRDVKEIVAYSNVKRITEMASALGADTSITYIKFGV